MVFFEHACDQRFVGGFLLELFSVHKTYKTLHNRESWMLLSIGYKHPHAWNDYCNETLNLLASLFYVL